MYQTLVFSKINHYLTKKELL